MKPRKSSAAASRKRSGGSTLLGLFIGLVIGVLAAAGVVWYIFKTPAPFTNKAQSAAPQPAPPPAASAAPSGTPAGAPATTASTPMALPGKPGDPVPANGDKPRFDFYKILPGSGDEIAKATPPANKQPDGKQPDSKPAESKPSDPLKEKTDITLKEAVFLQTGSFQSAADADGQKAKLAMMGIEASVQQVMLQEKVWYRVRLGPFKKVDELNSMRSNLAKQGVEVNVVKKD